ncbi:Cytoplasmic dynein 1 intermediate chain 1 [Fukomys damarensis]|uniref:Cytoplasmic dynein 1 intermediate chain 1 n=1 Tax=Fukomys damarensis TaxID=885580 RepID=A0A091CYU2_FUKDA|nr:Cytoplasmic dynein 1 intermediate chain 1 [Fukomys damarensis]
MLASSEPQLQKSPYCLRLPADSQQKVQGSQKSLLETGNLPQIQVFSKESKMSDKSDLKAELERKKQRLAQIREEKKRKEEERKRKEADMQQKKEPAQDDSDLDRKRRETEALLQSIGISPEPPLVSTPSEAGSQDSGDLGPLTRRRLHKLGVSKVTQVDFLPREVVSYSKETQTPLATHQSEGMMPMFALDEMRFGREPERDSTLPEDEEDANEGVFLVYQARKRTKVGRWPWSNPHPSDALQTAVVISVTDAGGAYVVRFSMGELGAFNAHVSLRSSESERPEEIVDAMLSIHLRSIS